MTAIVSPFRQHSFTSEAGDDFMHRASSKPNLLASLRVSTTSLPTTGPQGRVKPFTIIKDPAAWTAKDWEHGVDSLIHSLSPEEVDAVRGALAHFQASGRDLKDLKKPEDFPLPQAFADHLAGIKHVLLKGCGAALIRGMPVDEWTEAESVTAYMGLCAHIGQPGPQWKDGKLVTHVTSKGNSPTAPDAAARVGEAFNRTDDFGMHNDSCADVLGLLCIQQAKEGGESAFASALAVHNELLRRGRLDLVVVLAGAGFYRDKSRFQEVAPEENPLWEMPVFAYHDGFMTTSYNANLNQQCVERYPHLAGQLSPLQKEAMAAFNDIANDDAFKLRIRMQPGDIALVNNINLLHARTSFKDGELQHEKRHLVRLWLCCKDGNPLPKHLDFPRSYSINSYGPERRARPSLMRPAPSAFHVPLIDPELLGIVSE